MMKVWFVVLDDVFFLPPYLDATLERLDEDFEIVGITPVPDFDSVGEMYNLGRQRMEMFGVLPTAVLGGLTLTFRGLDVFDFDGRLFSRKFSIESVAKKYDIPIVETDDVNDSEFIERIRSEDVDVLVSSNPAIFSTELLEAPNIGCINRHTSYLPENKGLYPVYWALLEDQDYSGAAVHWMEEDIDEGEILTRERIPIHSGDTLISLYVRGYKLSAKLTATALRQIHDGTPKPIKNSGGTYHSYPEESDIKMFKQQDQSVLRLDDVLHLIRW